MCTIYCLCDPSNKEIRYIGQTVNSLNKRMAIHIYYAKKNGNSRLYKWIRYILSQGLVPTIEVLQENAIWNIDEIQWIQAYKVIGYDLVNGTQGGDGTLGHTHQVSVESKNKMSIIAKNSFKHGRKHAMLGKRHDNEAKNKIKEKRVNQKIWRHKKVICLNTEETYNSCREAEIKNNIHRGGVSGVCCNKNRKTAGGLKWQFLNEN